MTEEELTIVRAAASILHTEGLALLGKYDHLSELLGFLGAEMCDEAKSLHRLALAIDRNMPSLIPSALVADATGPPPFNSRRVRDTDVAE